MRLNARCTKYSLSGRKRYLRIRQRIIFVQKFVRVSNFFSFLKFICDNMNVVIVAFPSNETLLSSQTSHHCNPKGL